MLGICHRLFSKKANFFPFFVTVAIRVFLPFGEVSRRGHIAVTEGQSQKRSIFLYPSPMFPFPGILKGPRPLSRFSDGVGNPKGDGETQSEGFSLPLSVFLCERFFSREKKCEKIGKSNYLPKNLSYFPESKNLCNFRESYPFTSTLTKIPFPTFLCASAKTSAIRRLAAALKRHFTTTRSRYTLFSL